MAIGAWSEQQLSARVQELLDRSRLAVLVRQLQGGVLAGTGTPEARVVAPVSTLYRRRDGGAGTSLYVKESGAGNTGWVAK